MEVGGGGSGGLESADSRSNDVIGEARVWGEEPRGGLADSEQTSVLGHDVMAVGDLHFSS